MKQLGWFIQGMQFGAKALYQFTQTLMPRCWYAIIPAVILGAILGGIFGVIGGYLQQRCAS
jgi:ABC-type uncharacterized transport system permease subunit